MKGQIKGHIKIFVHPKVLRVCPLCLLSMTEDYDAKICHPLKPPMLKFASETAFPNPNSHVNPTSVLYAIIPLNPPPPPRLHQPHIVPLSSHSYCAPNGHRCRASSLTLNLLSRTALPVSLLTPSPSVLQKGHYQSSEPVARPGRRQWGLRRLQRRLCKTVRISRSPSFFSRMM